LICLIYYYIDDITDKNLRIEYKILVSENQLSLN
jgi:hypothetical protein